MEYYPSWRYHRTENPRLVRNTKEDEALGKGWEDTPAKFKDEVPPEQVAAVVGEPDAPEEPKKKEPRKWGR